jgi:hypothetical protein
MFARKDARRAQQDVASNSAARRAAARSALINARCAERHPAAQARRSACYAASKRERRADADLQPRPFVALMLPDGAAMMLLY